ncbi:MAG: hypothetical protein SGBAC_010852 [Bacillariaceae sp.]
MTAEASSSGDDDIDQLKSSKHSKKVQKESDDDGSMNNDTEKSKKLRKKKKKILKKDAEGGEVKKKKKKKKRPTEAAPVDSNGGGGGMDTMPLKLPVRRQSHKDIDVAGMSDSETEDDVEADDATAKASGQGNKRSNSTGTYDKQVHVRFLEAQKRREKAQAVLASRTSGFASDNDNDSDSDSDTLHDNDSSPRAVPRNQRPARVRKGPNDARYKSDSLGALDKKKHQLVMRKKQSIRIPAGSRQRMRYMSSDDEGDASSAASSSAHESEEGEMTLGGDDIPSLPSRTRGSGNGSGEGEMALGGDEIPSHPVRTRGTGQPKFRSTSAGVLDKNLRDRMLQKLSDDEARRQDGGTSEEDEVPDRPRRPQRVKRGSNQPRFRSTSAGALEKKKNQMYNSRAPPNGSNFLKPRKRSVGAIKAKETLQRSEEESSLHQVQPNIRVALPRLRSAGALNARTSGSTTSRRSSRDRNIPQHSDSDRSESPADRKVQSERVLRVGLGASIDDDDSSSDASAESEVIVVPSAPLPKSFRPTRNWADASKQLDQLPSVTRTSSAQSLPGNNQNCAAAGGLVPAPSSADTSVVTQGDVWMETLNDTNAEKKMKKKKKVKKTGSNSSLDSVSEHKKKTKKKEKPRRKSSAPGLESGSYH